MKITLCDLLTFICGGTPIGVGLAEGKKAGFFGITIGLIVGSVIGLVVFLLVRLGIQRCSRFLQNTNSPILNGFIVFFIYLGLPLIIWISAIGSLVVVRALIF